MTEPSKPRAGGAILALAILAGTLIGIAFHQPSIGIVAGTGVGIVAAILVWLRDRAR